MAPSKIPPPVFVFGRSKVLVPSGFPPRALSGGAAARLHHEARLRARALLQLPLRLPLGRGRIRGGQEAPALLTRDAGGGGGLARGGGGEGPHPPWGGGSLVSPTSVVHGGN